MFRNIRGQCWYVAVQALLLVFAAGIFLDAMVLQPPAPAQIEPAGRAAYQASLADEQEGHKFYLASLMVANDGTIVLYPSPTMNCQYDCGVARQTAEGYDVSLPVGFSEPGASLQGTLPTVAIHSLTYWDPVHHRKATVTRGPKEANLYLPEVLMKRRVDAVTKVGEVVYTSPFFIRDTGHGLVVVSRAFASREWLAYGPDTAIARLERTSSGFVATCMQGSTVLMDETADGLPVRIKDSCP